MEKKIFSINIILGVLILILIGAEVFILNKYSTLGDEVSKISQKITNIEKENDNLGQKIASSSSMTMIAQRAKKFGLADPTQVISLGTSLPLAANVGMSL